jgi:uncharacterized protein involved in exopolysaccharide biosynthesis
MDNGGSGFVTKIKPHLPELKKGAGLIIGSGLLSAAVAYGIIAARPAEYRATSSLILPASAVSSLTAALPFLSKEASPLSVLTGIGKSSRTFLELSQATKISTEELRNRLHWEENATTNQLTVSYVDAKKDRAVNVVNMARTILDKTSVTVSAGLGSSQADEINSVLKDRAAKLAELEEGLLTFQKELQTAPDAANPFGSGAYFARLKEVELDLAKVDKQIEVERAAAVRRGEPELERTSGPANPTWREKLATAEFELRVAETRLGPDAPEVEALRRKLTVTRLQLQKEIQKYIASVQDGLDGKFAALESKRQVLEIQREYLTEQSKLAPPESLEFQRRVREIEGQAKIVADLQRQYELAKLDSEVYRIQYTTLQPTYIEPEPVNKDAAKPTLFSLIGGLLTSAYCIIFAGLWRRDAAATSRPAED